MHNPKPVRMVRTLFLTLVLSINLGYANNQITLPCQSFANGIDSITSDINFWDTLLTKELDSFYILNKSLKDCSELENNDEFYISTFFNEAFVLLTLKEFDLALDVLEKGRRIAEDRNIYIDEVEFYRQIGWVLDAKGKIGASLESFQKGVFLCQKYGFKPEEITLNEHIAYALLTYYSNDSLNREKAIELYEKNLTLARLNQEDSISIQSSMYHLNRIKKNYDAALDNLEKLKNNVLYDRELAITEEGIIHLLKGDTLIAKKVFENLFLKLKRKKKFTSSIFIALEQLQSIALAQNDFNTAFDYGNENYNTAKEWQNATYLLKAVKNLMGLYTHQGDFENAYKFSKKVSILEEDAYGNRSKSTRKMYQHRIHLEKEQFKNELLNKDLLYATNKNIALGLLSVLSSLFLGLCAFYIFYRKKQYKIVGEMNQKLVATNQQLDLQNTKISNQLSVIEDQAELLNQQIKDKELQLSQKMLFLVHKNELIEKLDNEIKTNNDFNSLKFNLSKLLKKEQSEDSWKELNFQFQQSNQKFFNTLKEKHPTLSSQELRLCSLLKLNLSTKEISALTLIKPESVKVARSRLRKKLNLTNKTTTILDYLLTLDQ